ncbi:F-box/LRR-repeat protein 7 isoform X4 [Bombyx mori]|uniref:F-box/LRR-repeat protein 7 isoform X4 n=1 Tax=Bombyx mori TaxID=7091 RepID=UPI002ED0F483
MYNDEEDNERYFSPDLLHVVRIATISNLELAPYGIRSVPTKTEDGIPIRKLYVTNLPPKTTRTELYGVFAQYGLIKSCWLKMGDKGPNKTPIPTYAFVTFSNPADAHQALEAPSHEKILRGRNLYTSPADSWHQPVEDADGRVCWKPRFSRTNVRSRSRSKDLDEGTSTKMSTVATLDSSESSDEEDVKSCTILDVLNRDCLTHILNYIPIRDIILSERVSKGWQIMVQEYLAGVRVLKTSWWQAEAARLTTAVLRRVLARVGDSLLALHIDHHWSALNDRTAHSIARFCPKLEELKIVGMHTKNWNPLLYGCKKLKNLSFISCNKLTDSSLVHLAHVDSCIEKITVANNTHVTGLFLTGAAPPQLSSLSFYNCYSLQGTVLSAAMDSLPNLTTLKLDLCPAAMWKIVPMILKTLSKLEELSLSEYMSSEVCFTTQSSDEFCEALTGLTELRRLNLSRNIHITNAVLKQIGQTCHKLEYLNVSSCNSRKNFPQPGVSDEGLAALWAGCRRLRELDVSYLAGLGGAGLAGQGGAARLRRFTARGNPALSAAGPAALLAAAPCLQEMDLCGCDGVSEEIVEAAVNALALNPRHLLLRLAGTGAAQAQEELPKHRLLTVNVADDLCNPNMRPDFVDRIFGNDSDESFDDLYDHDDFEDLFGSGESRFNYLNTLHVGRSHRYIVTLKSVVVVALKIRRPVHSC